MAQRWVKLLAPPCNCALGTLSQPAVEPMCAHRQRPCAAVWPYCSNKHACFSLVLSYMSLSPVQSFSSSSPAPQSQQMYPLSPYLSTLHSLACVDLSGYKLCGVEFSLLSSWLHLIEHDVVYVFTTSLHSSHLFREDAL